MATNFKKNDISKDLSKITGYSFLYSKKIINDLMRLMDENICNGFLSLKNFGIFKLTNKKQRLGRNPKTKKEFIISARKSIKFIPSKKFIEFLNKT